MKLWQMKMKWTEVRFDEILFTIKRDQEFSFFGQNIGLKGKIMSFN